MESTQLLCMRIATWFGNRLNPSKQGLKILWACIYFPLATLHYGHFWNFLLQHNSLKFSPCDDNFPSNLNIPHPQHIIQNSISNLYDKKENAATRVKLCALVFGQNFLKPTTVYQFVACDMQKRAHSFQAFLHNNIKALESTFFRFER